MFESLSDRFDGILGRLRGKGRLSESDVAEAMREIRLALLEADVHFNVVKRFVERTQARCLEAEITESLTPGQQVVKVVNEELAVILGGQSLQLTYAQKSPTVVLMAGLQGSGKTTSSAKLARWFKSQGRTPLLVGADLQRPAAVEQLQTLAGQIEVPVFSSPGDPVKTTQAGLAEARRTGRDVLIVDTAGRLTIDRELMDEIAAISDAVDPNYTFLVVDAMAGQDAVNTAEAFHATLELDGIILTKLDGDARGGAALSIRHQTGRPIKFIGTGENNDALDPFHPDRIASRILGMGDVLSLVEEVERKVDREKAEKVARKLGKGKAFDLGDFREQLEQMNHLGGLAGMLDKLPGAGNLPSGVLDQASQVQTGRLVAIINSMTPRERRHPALIKGSRKRRIAGGSGTEVQEVNRLLKQFAQLQKMMKKAKGKKGMAQILGQMKGGGMSGMPPFGH